jgi:hypothetical protein
MRQWQIDAVELLRDSSTFAIQEGSLALHRASTRGVEAMCADGLKMPSDLQCYAMVMRELFESDLIRDHGKLVTASGLSETKMR